MRRVLSTLKDVYDKFVMGCNAISVTVTFLMALWVTADVIGRYFFSHPIPGTTELVKTGICAIVFLGVGYTMQKGRHVRTTVIVQSLSPAIRNYFNIINCLIGIVIFTLLCIFASKAAWVSWLVGEFDGEQLQVPVYPSRFAVVIGSGLLVIQSILNLCNHLGALMTYSEREGS